MISTAGDASLTRRTRGTLSNGAFSLLEPLGIVVLEVRVEPLPVANDPVTITFSQHIGATEPLRTGAYADADFTSVDDDAVTRQGAPARDRRPRFSVSCPMRRMPSPG